MSNEHHHHNYLEVGGYPESGLPSDLDNWGCHNNTMELGKGSLAPKKEGSETILELKDLISMAILVFMLVCKQFKIMTF